jgi:hypothetical protein
MSTAALFSHLSARLLVVSRKPPVLGVINVYKSKWQNTVNDTSRNLIHHRSIPHHKGLIEILPSIYFSWRSSILQPRPPHCWDFEITHSHTPTHTHTHTHIYTNSYTLTQICNVWIYVNFLCTRKCHWQGEDPNTSTEYTVMPNCGPLLYGCGHTDRKILTVGF